MDKRITKICFDDFYGKTAIEVTFSNDRHHRVVVEYPHGAKEVHDTLMRLAINILEDMKLASNAPSSPAAKQSGGMNG